MTIASDAAELLTVSQICTRLPGKRRGRLHPSTVARWILRGCPARNGERVRLAATHAGSRWLVHPDDLSEFFRRLAANPASQDSAPPTRTPTQRQLASERAVARLVKAGA